MKKLVDITLFTVFVIGGLLLANIAVLTTPLILLLAVFLAVLYWRTRRRVLACFCVVYAMLLLVIPIPIAGLLLAGYQWDRITAIPQELDRDEEKAGLKSYTLPLGKG